MGEPGQRPFVAAPGLGDVHVDRQHVIAQGPVPIVCLTNPDVRRIIIDKTLDRLRKDPACMKMLVSRTGSTVMVPSGQGAPVHWGGGVGPVLASTCFEVVKRCGSPDSDSKIHPGADPPGFAALRLRVAMEATCFRDPCG